jgi:hypothetical protein
MSEIEIYERVSVESGGIRIPSCPRCGTPNIVSRKVERATFAECANNECDAWIAYDIRVTAVACDTRELAKYRFETYIYDDDDSEDFRI